MKLSLTFHKPKDKVKPEHDFDFRYLVLTENGFSICQYLSDDGWFMDEESRVFKFNEVQWWADVMGIWDTLDEVDAKHD